MENTILYLIKIIAVLYFNDKSGDNNEQIFGEINEFLKGVKIDNRSAAMLGGEESIVEALRNTADYMIYFKNGFNIEDLNQRLSINFQGNNEYVLIAKETLNSEVTPDEARDRVLSIMRELQYEKKINKLKKIISTSNNVINYSGEHIEVDKFMNDVVSGITELQSSSNRETAGLVGSIDFEDETSIQEALYQGVSLVTEEGMLNTGFIGLNEALGGGISRGYYYDIAGLTHHYKSGHLLDLTLNVPMFNVPWLWDKSKRPLILRFSFENTVDLDGTFLYQKLYAIQHKELIPVKEIDIGVAKKSLKEHFNQNGYSAQILHYDPSSFCVYDLFLILKHYIEKGYEIHFLVLDYPHLFAHNTFGETMESKIKNTVEMIRNFCYSRGITVAAGHQLNTEAQSLATEHKALFTQKVVGNGYTMGCKSLATKFDIEMVSHIVKHFDGKSYLTLSKGKHRGCTSVPESKKHFAYMFEDYGIVPDYGETSRALKSLPSVIGADMGSNSW